MSLKNIFEKAEKFQITILAVIIASGAVASSKIVTLSIPHDGISVTGSSYEIVKSDSGKLMFEITAQAKTKASAYQLIKQQLPIVKKYLEEKGIKKVTVKNYTGYYTYKYNQTTGNYTNEVDLYKLSQPIEATSDNVDLIKEVSLDIQNLVDKGIDINDTRAEYFYSKLSDLKVKLLKSATIDAKNRASAMLSANNNRVGKIQSVKMGVFQITDVDSTNVSDMGINDTSTIDKKITAVANVVFKIK